MASDPHDSHSHSSGCHCASSHSHGAFGGEGVELGFSLISGATLLAGFLIEKSASFSPTVSLVCYLLALGFGGWFAAGEAISAVRNGRFEIDFLMLVAAAGAAFLDKWAEGGLLLFLFSLGHSLEHYAMGRARHAIEALADLTPNEALVRRNGSLETVKVEELKIDDLVIIKPHERIPADGFVVAGESTVDQAPLTGESVPVDKRPVDDPKIITSELRKLAPEHQLFAGSINQRGALEMRVTKLSGESTLARVVQMVHEAETRQSPTQQFTNRVERIYVPSVLIFVLALLFAWVVIDESFGDSFYRAMAVLVAASPCALALSTPSAVLSGVARAARGGVLVKGGAPLENLGRLDAIAFDKTGTLTEGHPRLTDVVTSPDVSESELLDTLVAVEQLSDHPLATAVVRDGVTRLGRPVTTVASNLLSRTGRGISATLSGETVDIGKDDLFDEIDGPHMPDDLRHSVKSLEASGRTTMVVRRGERYLGALGLMDTPRPSAHSMISRLRQLGIHRMIMISGDNQTVASAVAKEVGLDEAWGDLMPEDKVAAIHRLREDKAVAMVGDGVNDAPAMAHATVGIAMGAVGSDVALETADVALMGDHLHQIPFAVGLSRTTSKIIKQNLWISLGTVALLVPATLFGLKMGFAVLFHEGSTLLVVLNALRLLAYREEN